MKADHKNKIAQITFGLNAVLFMLGGIMLLNDGKPIFGILQLLASVSNFALLIPFNNQRTKNRLNYVVLTMNIIVALSVAIDYIQSGKQYLQYVWMLAALFSVVALIIQFNKRKTLLNE